MPKKREQKVRGGGIRDGRQKGPRAKMAGRGARDSRGYQAEAVLEACHADKLTAGHPKLVSGSASASITQEIPCEASEGNKLGMTDLQFGTTTTPSKDKALAAKRRLQKANLKRTQICKKCAQ